jgi:hypothetical protein
MKTLIIRADLHVRRFLSARMPEHRNATRRAEAEQKTSWVEFGGALGGRS